MWANRGFFRDLCVFKFSIGSACALQCSSRVIFNRYNFKQIYFLTDLFLTDLFLNRFIFNRFIFNACTVNINRFIFIVILS